MSAAEDDGAEYIGELAELHHERDQLRAACQLAVFACRENLAMWGYKNETLLLKALTACENALKSTEHQHGRRE